jgi:cyanophycin synthetase
LAASAEALPADALLAAVAAAWAMGIEPDLISAGVQTFGPAPAATRTAMPRVPLEDRKND